ncbi:unnamed protein product [Acidithrix sp. C25]|nr:unnamed protein product [Acidithrix sp. C25]
MHASAFFGQFAFSAPAKELYQLTNRVCQTLPERMNFPLGS